MIKEPVLLMHYTKFLAASCKKNNLMICEVTYANKIDELKQNVPQLPETETRHWHNLMQYRNKELINHQTPK